MTAPERRGRVDGKVVVVSGPAGWGQRSSTRSQAKRRVASRLTST
jgi:hypothetical protein